MEKRVDYRVCVVIMALAFICLSIYFKNLLMILALLYLFGAYSTYLYSADKYMNLYNIDNAKYASDYHQNNLNALLLDSFTWIKRYF